MPKTFEVVHQLSSLAQAHGRDKVDIALRESVAEGGLGHDRVTEAIVSAADNQVDLSDIQRRLDELAKIGRPLPPGPKLTNADHVIGARLGIQGNPIDLDQGYQGGWHFAQDNGWDIWVTIVPRAAGGYFIRNPAMRLTGEHGPAHVAIGGTGGIDANMNLVFDINWGGHVGHYVCSLDVRSRTISGRVSDLTNGGPERQFVGTVMKEADARPNNGPVQWMPNIKASAQHNQHDNGFNVTVTGGGFVPGEVVTIEGRAQKGSTVWKWAFYTSATVDAFGRFECPEFGISKPADTTFTFRGLSEHTGYTGEVEI